MTAGSTTITGAINPKRNKGQGVKMWNYIKQYLPFAIIAGLFMVGEVLMDLIQPGLMSKIVDEGVLGLSNSGAGSLNTILTMGFAMICLALFGGFCGSMNNVFVHYSGQNIGNEMRKDCFCTIMSFSFPQMDQFGTGTLVTRVTNDITQVQNLVSQFVRGMIRTSMLMFGSIFFMFRLNRNFGLIVLCAYPFLVGCLAFCLLKANPLIEKLQTQLDSINSIMQEDISGIRVIKACVREAYEKLRFGKANGELNQTQFRMLIIFAFMNPSVNALMYLVAAVILLAGSFETGAGGATPGTVMAAITYTTQLLNGILMLAMLFQNISKGIVSWKRVKEILTCRPALADGAFEGNTRLCGEIEFRNVTFSYADSRIVLDDISFCVHKGETVAIMGATGCGKTSLVSLIPRFYDVVKGSVMVDGVDVREYRQQDLRQKIAFVLQKSELFNMSIKENILWGDETSDDEKVKAAAVIAQADDFITSSSGGYDTAVAERGMSLSGGQKQRISISRAVLKNAEILILDDSTSALDLKTEADFYKALKTSNPTSTKLIVAQRVASARTADRIIVLEKGKIAAIGTHEELLRSCAAYQDICRSQIGKEAMCGEQ